MLSVSIRWNDGFSPMLQAISDRGLANAIRRAVDKTARDARKVAIPIIAADIGVPPARIRAATPVVKASTQASLSASWTIGKLAIGIGNVQGARVSKADGLTASTHRVTGGGSASLRVPKAFEVKSNGGRFIARRIGKASRLPIKVIHAQHPATAMGQTKAAARKFWTAQAEVGLQRQLPVELAKAIGGRG